MKYLLIAAVAAVSLANINTSASAASVSCTIPNAVKCTVTSQKGLKQVWVQSTQGFGTLASKSFRNCPKTASITWDSAFGGDVKFKECKGMGFKPVGAAPKRNLHISG